MTFDLAENLEEDPLDDIEEEIKEKEKFIEEDRLQEIKNDNE